jgi:hypothetical protein
MRIRADPQHWKFQIQTRHSPRKILLSLNLDQDPHCLKS